MEHKHHEMCNDATGCHPDCQKSAIEKINAQFEIDAKNRTRLAKELDSLREQELEWILDQYWGLKVHRAYDAFDRIYDKLVELGATYKDRVVWGDADCGAWVEPHEKKKIVCLEVYCAMRDDNTYLYIGPKEYHDELMFKTLHARTCWPRQKLWKHGKDCWGMEDWRSVTRPSIHTYRRFDFEPGYRDGRDVGYGFTLNYLGHDRHPNVEDATWHTPDTRAALRELLSIEAGLEDPLELPGGKK
jgi:hypothetical protein